MLLTLLKHEYKYIIKTFTFIYAVFFAITLVFKILLHIAVDEHGDVSSSFTTIFVIFAVMWYVSFFIIGLMTITNNTRRFKKSMFGPEGYLSNTLPVTTTSLIVAKIIAGATNYVLSYIAILLSVNILVIGFEGSNKAMKAIVDGVGELFSDHFDIVFAFFFFSAALYLAFILYCYMLSSISSMIGGSKAKSFGIGFGLFILNILIVSALSEALDGSSTIGIFFGMGTYYLIVAVIEFLVVHNIVKNKLNLQ